MIRNLALSFGALGAFIVLAFGSSSTSNDVEVVGDVVREVEPAAAAATAPDGGDAAAGECCCKHMEADQEAHRFMAKADCTGQHGTCESSTAACEATEAADEASAGTCCCAATEQIIAQGAPCDGTCYEFYEQGDDPGSCIY